MKIEVEVCAGSLADCLAAQNGGATRIELNSALSTGGLTPSLGTLRLVKESVNLPVICMVRPRSAGFCYDELEKKVMFADAKILLENGADGIAFGFLNADGTVQADFTQKMTELIHSFEKEAVFHRAFDMTPDAEEAIKTLIDCKIDRVLTSGQQAKAEDGIPLLAHLQRTYGSEIEILPGSGITVENARNIIEETRVLQIHSSCKTYVEDETTIGRSVSFACLDAPYEKEFMVVDEAEVKRIKGVV